MKKFSIILSSVLMCIVLSSCGIFGLFRDIKKAGEGINEAREGLEDMRQELEEVLETNEIDVDKIKDEFSKALENLDEVITMDETKRKEMEEKFAEMRESAKNDKDRKAIDDLQKNYFKLFEIFGNVKDTAESEIDEIEDELEKTPTSEETTSPTTVEGSNDVSEDLKKEVDKLRKELEELANSMTTKES